MSLTPLLDALTQDSGVKAVLQAADDHIQVIDVAVAAGARGPLIAALTGTGRPEETGMPSARPVLAVTATGREADDLAAALRCFLPAERVVEFPSWETLPHERLSPRSDTVGRRLAVLRRLAHPDATDPAYGPVDVVVVSVRALQQPIAKGLGDLQPVALRQGDEAPLDDVVEALVAAAYTRTDLVERRGEFAVRGGILDVFPPTEQHPIRIEFFGDEVEEIRWFKVADQRSLEIAEHGLWAPPCRELLLTENVKARAAELAEQLPGVADMLHKVSQGIAVEGMESLGPALIGGLPQPGRPSTAEDGGMELLLDVLPKETHVVLCDPERIRRRAHDLVATSAEFLEASWANAAAGNNVPVDLQGVLGTASYWTMAELREHALSSGRPWWSLTSFATDAELAEFVENTEDESVDELITVESHDVEAYRGDTEKAVHDFRQWVAGRWRVLVVTEGPGLARRVGEVLGEHDVPTRPLSLEAAEGATALEPGVIHLTSGDLGRGFVLPSSEFIVVTESDLVGGTGTAGGSTKDMRKMPSRRRNQVDPLQLRPGDFVVHEQHGVGRFVEMVQRTVGGATREYLVLEYAPSKRGQPGDRLFVPTDQLDQVTRYVGGEQPTLNKLGGSDWARTKSRARKHVKQIAGELIRLYSARMASEGYAFGPDTPWQRELEDAFPYVETPDQLSSIDEVKADMAKPVPMDRLICGDVGYGKTEIAVRAAFKAVQDGRQVAVLVPTTLLVQQHMSTFTERFAAFPVVVKPISRFQTDAEINETLRGLSEGTVDIVVGTHRILSSQTRFKNLGLVVIDEEQRFGVEHKEELKRLRTQVDVLAMSATPIPRTLEMGLTGIREMSTILTPPEERHPVLTFVGPYEEKQIAAAIRRELLREGQVFFVHNRVRSINKVAANLARLVPEARIGIAHGQMNENELEKVMVDFWEKNYDVLVATTIVESGLDVPNANTLIVDRADMYGLSQLHQLRGRVGRGRERA
ncbi:MAG TPA: transcription-repair coupling factor, partial [Segeticoccus sp.]|uniref:transcription-repair coupling factor n=1 Tax=Segeticoccus sp. TaxID=2706531 RepID=UPI002D7F3647